MKRYLLWAALLAACQPADTNKGLPLEEGGSAPAVEEGVVRLRLNTPVSEPRACIIPITIENGLDNPTSVTMIAFDLRGPGDDAKGNMFAPAAAPGETSEARVIVEGQSCDAYDTLSIPEIRCTSGDENCASFVELVDGEDLRFSQAG